MSDLEKKALARVSTLTALDVQRVYLRFDRTGNDPYYNLVRDLCESHERLRMELAGAEALLAEREQSVIVIEDDGDGDGDEDDTSLWTPGEFGGEGG